MSEQELHNEKYIKSLMQEGGTEQPSSHFTTNIVEAINAQATSSSFAYKPVISKKAWIILAVVGLAIFLYLLFLNPSSGEGLSLYGYSLNLDLSKAKGLFNKVAFSFELTPIFKTSIIALVIFTFSNLILFELKNRSFIK